MIVAAAAAMALLAVTSAAAASIPTPAAWLTNAARTPAQLCLANGLGDGPGVAFSAMQMYQPAGVDPWVGRYHAGSGKVTVPAHSTLWAAATGSYLDGWSMLSGWRPGLAVAVNDDPPWAGIATDAVDNVPGGTFRSPTDSQIYANSSDSAQTISIGIYGIGNWGGPSITGTAYFFAKDGNDQVVGSTCPLLSNVAVNNTLGKQNLAATVADPVNSATGNLVHAAVDLEAPVGVYGVGLARTYNSLDDSALWPVPAGRGYLWSPFGARWTTSFDTTVTPLDQSQSPPGSVRGLELRFPDGRRVQAAGYDAGAAQWAVPATLMSSVVSIAWDATASQYVVTLVGGEQWRYRSTGSLSRKTAPDGQFVQICYPPDALLKVRHGDSSSPSDLCTASGSARLDTDLAVNWQVVLTDTNTDGIADRARLQYRGGSNDDPVVDYWARNGWLLAASRPHRADEPATDAVAWTEAGSGTVGAGGDGGPAWLAQMNTPSGLAIDGSGAVYVSDTANNRVRRIAAGQVTTYAGTGTAGSSGDGGQAIAAQLSGPTGLAFGPDGSLYVADSANHRVRRITARGVISTVAGTGTSGFSGDGGPATAAKLSTPKAVAVDGSSLYIADTGNHRVRVVAADGSITTLAGTGTPGFSGDGGPAATALLNTPSGVAVNTATHDVFIADTANHRIRRVTGTNIDTVAGNGNAGNGGDGGPATTAQLNGPTGLSVEASGGVVVADTGSHRVRRFTAGATMTLVAGSTQGSAGDFGPATTAKLSSPKAAAIDSAGFLHVADSANNRVRATTVLPGETYLMDGDLGLMGTVLEARDTGLEPNVAVFNTYDAFGRVAWQNQASGDHTSLSYGNPTGSPPTRTTTVKFCATYQLSDGTCTGALESFTYTHDDRGRALGATDSTSAAAGTTRTWTAQDQPSRFVDRAANESANQYDSSQRMARTYAPDPVTGTIPSTLPDLSTDIGSSTYAVSELVYCNSAAGDWRPALAIDAAGAVTKYQ